MKVAYLDCASGISGDMTLGALIDAGVDLASVQAGVSSLGLPDCRLRSRHVKKQGFRGTQVEVEHPPEHAHRHLHHIVAMIEGSDLTLRQKELSVAIFTKLADAEAKVHGTTTEKVHFHEVGAVDSIADIVGTSIAWDLLGIEQAYASPVPTGRGFVEIAHGRLSIPAPATGELLKGVPLAESTVEGELTTPTGAAILAALIDSYGSVPEMTIEAIGYGAGQRDYEEQPNLLRILVGQQEAAGGGKPIWVVETNLDDVSAEVIGYCTSRLWQAGSLDVYTTPIQMKKNRPGVKLTVLCGSEDVARIETILFQETTTLGVRRWKVQRTTLARRPHQVTTPWGSVEGVLVSHAGGEPRFSPEYEACRRIAEEKKLPLKDVYEAALWAYRPGQENRP